MANMFQKVANVFILLTCTLYILPSENRSNVYCRCSTCGPTSACQQSLFWPHQYLLTIPLLATPVLVNNPSSGPTSAWQQSLVWPYKCLLTIPLLALPVLVNNPSSGPTSAWQQSLLLALPVLVNILPSGPTSACQQSLFWHH